MKSGPGFQKAGNSRLVAVMGRNAERHHVEKWCADADALVADPKVDVIYIATPPSSHMEHALRAARAGKPAYVGKPMALNHERGADR